MIEEGDRLKSPYTTYVYTVTQIGDDGRTILNGPNGDVFTSKMQVEGDIEENRLDVITDE